MSGIDKSSSAVDEAKKTEPEEVRVDKNVDAKEGTRFPCHICPLCDDQLHKICSTDANIAIIAVAKEGAPKDWGTEGQAATSEAGKSKSAVSVTL